MKEKKKSHQIQFKPSVHAKGKQLAQDLGISFQELLERLILNAVGETTNYESIQLDCLDMAVGLKLPSKDELNKYSNNILNAVGITHED
jgi:hypothetical protein